MNASSVYECACGPTHDRGDGRCARCAKPRATFKPRAGNAMSEERDPPPGQAAPPEPHPPLGLPTLSCTTPGCDADASDYGSVSLVTGDAYCGRCAFARRYRRRHPGASIAARAQMMRSLERLQAMGVRRW